MPEITVTGVNGITYPTMATWGWEIALYLFLGGLVAGLMVFSGAMRLSRPDTFRRALLVADLTSLPLLGVGMLCLLIDLANKANVWRFYTTFQVQSAMSWGAWVLLLTMVLQALRFVSLTPTPRPAVFLGISLFPPALIVEEKLPETAGEESVETVPQKPNPAASFLEWGWRLLHHIGRWTNRGNSALAVLGIVLGIGVGFYTGVLLSTIPSRPLWNTALLAPLFLVSGLASGGAFLCLFLPAEEHHWLVPFSLLSCGVELLLLTALAINLNFGSRSVQRAGSLLFSGTLGWGFWGVVILLGLLIPGALELLDWTHHRIPLVPARFPPMLKLVGGLALRFVIVYAGLLSFV